jgi:hypothetical protein
MSITRLRATWVTQSRSRSTPRFSKDERRHVRQ